MDEFYGYYYARPYGPALKSVWLSTTRNQELPQVFLSPGLLLPRLSQQDHKVVVFCNSVQGDIRYIPSENYWAQLQPFSTVYDVKMSWFCTAYSLVVPGILLVTSLQISLIYFVHNCPAVLHTVHHFPHYPDSTHVRAIAHLQYYLAGMADLPLLVGHWTELNLQYISESNASSENAEFEFQGMSGVMVFVMGIGLNVGLTVCLVTNILLLLLNKVPIGALRPLWDSVVPYWVTFGSGPYTRHYWVTLGTGPNTCHCRHCGCFLSLLSFLSL